MKYLPRQGGNSQCTGDKDLNYRNNLRVYRYAETLLNAAELILRTGGDTAEAQKLSGSGKSQSLSYYCRKFGSSLRLLPILIMFWKKDILSCMVKVSVSGIWYVQEKLMRF